MEYPPQEPTPQAASYGMISPHWDNQWVGFVSKVDNLALGELSL